MIKTFPDQKTDLRIFGPPQDEPDEALRGKAPSLILGVRIAADDLSGKERLGFRMIQMGLIDAEWPLSPRDRRIDAWSDTTGDPAWRARQMAVYAAMIDRMDQGIGKIVTALRKRGNFDNTLVLFLSDNGGCDEAPGLPWISRFATDQEDTSRWGNRTDVQAGPRGTFQSYGIPWANASNTPFRRYKSEVHEGGIATPLVAHWPAGIGSALRGRLVEDPGHVIDLMATSVDLAGTGYPAAHGGREVQPMEGVSLRPAFEGKPLARGKPLFFEHEGNRAITEGSWKLVSMAGKKWELYHLKADRTEQQDLAGEQPERAERMAALWTEWAKRAMVIP